MRFLEVQSAARIPEPNCGHSTADPVSMLTGQGFRGLCDPRWFCIPLYRPPASQQNFETVFGICIGCNIYNLFN